MFSKAFFFLVLMKTWLFWIITAVWACDLFVFQGNRILSKWYTPTCLYFWCMNMYYWCYCKFGYDIMQNHCLNTMPGPLYFSALCIAMILLCCSVMYSKFFLKNNEKHILDTSECLEHIQNFENGHGCLTIILLMEQTSWCPFYPSLLICKVHFCKS